MIYLLRKVARDVVQIAKFEYSSEPTDVYSLNLKTKRCDCPSPRVPCKHWDLVQEWRTGHYFDDDALVPNPILDTTAMEQLLGKE